MNAHVLCVDTNTLRSMDQRKHLKDAGFLVLHAHDESQAIELLQSCRVDVICINSSVGNAEPGVAACLKNVQPHIPVVLIRDSGAIPDLLQEHVDVVVEEPDFGATAQWLIEKLRDADCVFFARWFADWMRRPCELRTDEPFHSC